MDRHLDAELAAQFGVQGHQLQRVAARVEEVVVGPDGFHAEQRGPDGADATLQLAARLLSTVDGGRRGTGVDGAVPVPAGRTGRLQHAVRVADNGAEHLDVGARQVGRRGRGEPVTAVQQGAGQPVTGNRQADGHRELADRADGTRGG